MAHDIYHLLRERLDRYSHGFAATESGIEIKILERFFTVEEAHMYLHLSDKLQSTVEIAEKSGLPIEKASDLLHQMTEKGLTFPKFSKKPDAPCYFAAAPWSHGIWEHNARFLDRGTSEMILDYFRQGVFTRGPNPIRSIPVNSSIQANQKIAPFDNVKSIILSKNLISVTPCACHDAHSAAGYRCDRDREVCIWFDFYAEYYIAQKKARRISADEAMALLIKTEKAGLVHQMANSLSPDSICNCCPECCLGMKFLKKMRKPAKATVTNFQARIYSEMCSGCGTCMDRCPVNAVTVNRDAVAEINPDRCIGCGLCVSTCPEGALSLRQKPEEAYWIPPLSAPVMRPSKEIEDSITSG
ncbi:MAG: 4Fe-4S binding protein [Desulfobacterales bacterium]